MQHTCVKRQPRVSVRLSLRIKCPPAKTRNEKDKGKCVFRSVCAWVFEGFHSFGGVVREEEAGESRDLLPFWAAATLSLAHRGRPPFLGLMPVDDGVDEVSLVCWLEGLCFEDLDFGNGLVTGVRSELTDGVGLLLIASNILLSVSD
jgi:hypothetical protein